MVHMRKKTECSAGQNTYYSNNIKRNICGVVGEKGGKKCAAALEVRLRHESDLSHKMHG